MNDESVGRVGREEWEKWWMALAGVAVFTPLPRIGLFAITSGPTIGPLRVTAMVILLAVVVFTLMAFTRPAMIWARLWAIAVWVAGMIFTAWAATILVVGLAGESALKPVLEVLALAVTVVVSVLLARLVYRPNVRLAGTRGRHDI